MSPSTTYALGQSSIFGSWQRYFMSAMGGKQTLSYAAAILKSMLVALMVALTLRERSSLVRFFVAHALVSAMGRKRTLLIEAQ